MKKPAALVKPPADAQDVSRAQAERRSLLRLQVDLRQQAEQLQQERAQFAAQQVRAPAPSSCSTFCS